MRVCIGSDAGDHVTIHALSKAENESGFFNAEIDVQAGFWRGRYPASPQVGDFPPFRKQLQQMYDWKDDRARFATMEGWLTLNLTLDHLGHVRVDGSATDYVRTGNVLTFHLDLDQSYLPRIIKELVAIESALTEA